MPADDSSAHGRTTKGTGAQGRPKGKPVPPPAQKKLASDCRFTDAVVADMLGEARKESIGTKVHPEIQAKLQGITLMAKQTGAPAGATTIAAIIQEALMRYFETIEQKDKLEIPRPYGR